MSGTDCPTASTEDIAVPTQSDSEKERVESAAEWIVIRAGQTERQYWRDLWRYRELFYFLAWRDILVRYKQTVIGVAWALVRPFLTMLVFTLVFSRIAKLPAREIRTVLGYSNGDEVIHRDDLVLLQEPAS